MKLWMVTLIADPADVSLIETTNKETPVDKGYSAEFHTWEEKPHRKPGGKVKIDGDGNVVDREPPTFEEELAELKKRFPKLMRVIPQMIAGAAKKQR